MSNTDKYSDDGLDEEIFDQIDYALDDIIGNSKKIEKIRKLLKDKVEWTNLNKDTQLIKAVDDIVSECLDLINESDFGQKRADFILNALFDILLYLKDKQLTLDAHTRKITDLK